VDVVWVMSYLCLRELDRLGLYAWWVGMGFGAGVRMGRLWCLDPSKKGSKTGPKIVFSEAPGRGVLRFLAGGYRNPVHFLAIFRVFSKN